MAPTETAHPGTWKPKTRRFVNLTPHPVHLYDPEGQTRLTTIPTSGHVARAMVREGTMDVCLEVLQTHDGVALPVVYAHDYDHVLGWPERPSRDVVYVVSAVVASTLRRTDRLGHAHIVVPDLSPESVVRRGSRIVGIRRWCR